MPHLQEALSGKDRETGNDNLRGSILEVQKLVLCGDLGGGH